MLDISDEPLTPEEWAEASAAQWRAMLQQEWSGHLISFSAAVHWIATSGELREADFEELEYSSVLLLDNVQSGNIQAYGRKGSFDEFSIATPMLFFGTWPFHGDPDAFAASNTPLLLWNCLLEADRTDTIERPSGEILWSCLSIERKQLTNADLCVPPISPYRTGAPGRPSAIAFVVKEAERRRVVGEANLKVSREAKDLREWCQREHPSITAPSAKTIENKIRPEHRQWMLAQLSPQL